MAEVVLVINELAAGLAYQQVSHRFMNGPEIDQVFSDERPCNSILWYLSDQQNTVRDVANFVYGVGNDKAVVRNHLEYDSFGNVTADNATTAAVNDGTAPGIEGSVTTTFSPQRSFTGREPDADIPSRSSHCSVVAGVFTVGEVREPRQLMQHGER